MRGFMTFFQFFSCSCISVVVRGNGEKKMKKKKRERVKKKTKKRRYKVLFPPLVVFSTDFRLCSLINCDK